MGGGIVVEMHMDHGVGHIFIRPEIYSRELEGHVVGSEIVRYGFFRFPYLPALFFGGERSARARHIIFYVLISAFEKIAKSVRVSIPVARDVWVESFVFFQKIVDIKSELHIHVCFFGSAEFCAGILIIMTGNNEDFYGCGCLRHRSKK